MYKEKYKTNNLYLATYLLCKKIELVDIDKENPKKALFIFLDRPDRENLVWKFLYAKEALVDARQYAITMKELKNKLYT